MMEKKITLVWEELFSYFVNREMKPNGQIINGETKPVNQLVRSFLFYSKITYGMMELFAMKQPWTRYWVLRFLKDPFSLWLQHWEAGKVRTSFQVGCVVLYFIYLSLTSHHISLLPINQSRQCNANEEANKIDVIQLPLMCEASQEWMKVRIAQKEVEQGRGYLSLFYLP